MKILACEPVCWYHVMANRTGCVPGFNSGIPDPAVKVGVLAAQAERFVIIPDLLEHAAME